MLQGTKKSGQEKRKKGNYFIVETQHIVQYILFNSCTYQYKTFPIYNKNNISVQIFTYGCTNQNIYSIHVNNVFLEYFLKKCNHE